jgi:hypothetical protein
MYQRRKERYDDAAAKNVPERGSKKSLNPNDKDLSRQSRPKPDSSLTEKNLSEKQRSHPRRLDLLKRQKANQSERIAHRRKPGLDRTLESALQQELAKLTSRAIRKLLRNGEEELLGLLSPMEQRTIRKVMNKLDAAATIIELKKALKKARKAKGAEPQSLGTESTTQEEASNSAAPQVMTANTTDTETGKTVGEGGPSKSLDLVTGKVDDGNNKNAYQAAVVSV